MGHQDQHVDVHHEGDAHQLAVTVENENEIIVDISGGSAHWLLFESEEDADDDTNAILQKQAADDSSNGPDSEIYFEAPRDGQLIVNIATGDTDGLVDWANLGDQDEVVTSVTYHHRLRVTVGGDRATVLHGDFTIYR